MSRVRRVVTIGLIAGALLLVILILSDSTAAQPGTQPASPVVRIKAADTQQWSVLTPEDGTTRDGWPRPMLATGDEVCFGFENGALRPSRPSLARCVVIETPLAPDEIISLVLVEAGLDVWHIVMTGTSVSSIELTTTSGTAVADGRIHIADDVVVLRLARDSPLREIAWTSGRTTVACEPLGDSIETGRFCAAD